MISLDVTPHHAGDASTTSRTDAPTSTARELAAAVGQLDLESLRKHHLALLLAVAELAGDAGTDWPWSPDDPTVALLRAVAKLSLDAPDASSPHAAALIAALGAGGARPSAG